MFHVMHLELASSQEDNETFIVLVRKGQTMVRLRQQPWLYIQPLDVKGIYSMKSLFPKTSYIHSDINYLQLRSQRSYQFSTQNSLQMENVDISTYWNLE